MRQQLVLALGTAWLLSLGPLAVAADSSSTKQSTAKPPAATATKPATSTTKTTPKATSCPCGAGKVCIGPRGGRYCINSSGNKRYVK